MRTLSKLALVLAATAVAVAASTEDVASTSFDEVLQIAAAHARVAQLEAELASAQVHLANVMAGVPADEEVAIAVGDDMNAVLEEAFEAVASDEDAPADFAVQATDSDRSAVASRAQGKAGSSYIAGHAGPNSFDCSGLVKWAWGKQGVSLPHYSKSQYTATRRISNPVPGDLVFYFGLGAHHVGIFIGNGKMVHAANPSKGVRIDDVMGSWYRERFTGYGRVP